MASKTSEFAMIEYAATDPNKPTQALAESEGDEPDLVAEKKLLRKLDFHLVPILFLLFLAAFLDRCATIHSLLDPY